MPKISSLLMLHPLLYFGGIFLVVTVISLIQGKISNRYAAPIYRYEDPQSFRNHIVFYATACFVCFFITIKNWTTEFDPPEYDWYIVTANPQESLETSLKSASKIKRDGEIAYGLTSWTVNWNFKWSKAKHGDSCWISSVYTTLSSRIVLPKLVNATPAQQEKFDKFFVALQAHQLAHYEFGKSAAQEIEKKISLLPKMSDCTIVEAAANAVGEQILENYETKGQAYDLTDNFLRSQHSML